MSNFARDIEDEAAGEPIQAVVIGPFGGWASGSDEDRIHRNTAARRGVVLNWDEARPMLDYEYSSGFGAPECDAVWAWTPTRVLFVGEYDGSTCIVSVPRNPVDGKPTMAPPQRD
jgi:hypothetical protein